MAAAVVGPEGILEERVAGAARPDSLFALASLTKPLVALAVMVAAEEGSIDLDAPVAEHLPAYRTPTKDAITARHLLSHASGLPEVGPRGVASLDVEPVHPLADPAGLLERGLRRAGRAAARRHRDRPRRIRAPGGVRAAAGWMRSWACPRLSPTERSTCASRVSGARGRRSSTRARGAHARPPPAARLRPPPPTPGSCSCCSGGGAPLLAPETFAEFARCSTPGWPAGSSRS